MFRCHLGTNIVAPVHNPRKILDVGAGSGRWAIEVAKEYPEAEVIGLDLSTVSPNFSTPSNCGFIVEDLTRGLCRFTDESYDLVHSR